VTVNRLSREQIERVAAHVAGGKRLPAEVLQQIVEGHTNREIAVQLGISHRTVETHRESLMRKLDVRTVAGLTRLALEAGLVGR